MIFWKLYVEGVGTQPGTYDSREKVQAAAQDTALRFPTRNVYILKSDGHCRTGIPEVNWIDRGEK